MCNAVRYKHTYIHTYTYVRSCTYISSVWGSLKLAPIIVAKIFEALTYPKHRWKITRLLCINNGKEESS